MTTTNTCCEECKNYDASSDPYEYGKFVRYCNNAACSCHTPPATKNLSWVEEFDREFPDRAFYENGRDLKAFFAAKLAQKKNDLVETIRGMKKSKASSRQAIMRELGYNQALTDVLRTLEL